MNETLRSLAAKTFTEIGAEEGALLDAVEKGEEAVSSGTSDVGIRSKLLEWICTNSSARPNIHRHGVAMLGFIVDGIVDLIHADIPFPLQFRACVFKSDIWLKGARLRSLIFRGCQLQGMNGDACQIDTNLLMIGGSSFGEIGFREAMIGAGFRTDGSTFTGNNSPALVCDRIKIAGGAFLSQVNARTTFSGEVRFPGADVGGNFDCEAAAFSNLGGAALNAERIHTAGSVFLRGSRAKGQVNLAACTIDVALDCRGAAFTGSNERTLNAERANVGSHVLLDGEFGCDSVHLLSATVEGGLRCRLSKIGKLDIRHARVDGPFEWADMIDPSGSTLDLRDAHLESIKDDEASWPDAGAIHLDGLTFQRFSESVTDVAKRLSWIGRDVSGPAQAYQQLSQVYERGGRSDLARTVLYQFEKLTRARQSGISVYCWNFILRCTIGYGYRLWRAGVLMFFLTLFGFGVGLLGYSDKLIVPSDKDANTAFIATGSIPPYYAGFSAFMYSMEHSLPGINLGIASNWSSNTTADRPKNQKLVQLIRYWFWLQTLLGWLLSIFFVAGLSGAIKARK